MPTGYRRRTQRLTGNLLVTTLRLDGPLTAAALRAMLATHWYVLLGQTTDAAGNPTGYGAYVGTSDALRAQTLRVGVSLRTWTYNLGRLQPQDVLLIRRLGKPLDEYPRLLVEAALARGISGAGWTLLNLRTAAPTAYQRATRQQRLWTEHIGARLAQLVRGRLLFHHPPAAAGGSAREQIVRLVLTQQPPRGMDVSDILDATRQANIDVPGAFPAQRTRRDCTTREAGSGRPRLYRTWINGRTIVYPSTISLRQARQTYLEAHGDEHEKQAC